MEKKKQHTLARKLGYACGDFYGGGSFLIVSTLYMGYLILVLGLTPVQTSAIIFVGRVWDAITDPIMGYISDRTHTPFGRRRIYFLIGSVLVALSFTLMWTSFGMVDTTQLIIYNALAYMFFGTAFTIVMVPYNAILSDMTDDYTQRTSYTGIRMIFSAGSALVCAVIPATIVNQLGSPIIGPDQKSGYTAMALVFGIIFGIFWILAFFGTKENQDLQKLPSEKHGIKEWGNVFKNKSYRSFIGIFLTIQISVDLLLALAVFYIDIVLMRPESYTLIVGTLAVCQLIFMVVVNQIAQKKGKQFPLFLGMPIWILASIGFFFFTPSSPVVAVCITVGIVAFGAAAGNLCVWSMLSDTYEVDELMTSKRHEGLYSGITTFLRKAASGLAILILGFGLQIVGFDQNEYTLLKTADATGDFNVAAYASSGTVSAIRVLFVVVPAVLLTFTIIFTLRYKLNNKRYNTVIQAIEKFRNTGTDIELTSDEKEDLELVTGHPVDSLWGGIVKNN